MKKELPLQTGVMSTLSELKRKKTLIHFNSYDTLLFSAIEMLLIWGFSLLWEYKK